MCRKSYRLWDNVEKNCRAGQATDNSTAHAHCMLGTWRYRHTPRIRNTYYVYTAREFTPTRLNVSFSSELPYDISPLTKTPRPALVPTKLSFQGYPGSFLVVKRSECEAKHSPPPPPYCRRQEWMELYFHFPYIPSWHGQEHLAF